MPTPAERQALIFLAGVIVLGAGVRVVRAARNDSGETQATRHALARQLAAVDSARAGEAAANGGRSGGRAKGKRTTSRPPRVRDSTVVASGSKGRSRTKASSGPPAPAPPVDLDVATESEIETLPRIGPALARRIVEDRTQNGAFGSLEELERVRGVGPSLAASLRERVTFSGTARPSNAVADQRLRSSSPRSKSSRRERRP